MPQTPKKKLQIGTNLIQDILILRSPMGLTISPQQIPDHSSEENFMGQQQTNLTDTNNSDENPKLEEDWENGQFADADRNLINRHNIHSESERIQKEYTEHLLDLTDNQYYSKEYPPESAVIFHPRPRILWATTKEIPHKTMRSCRLLPSTPRPSRHSALVHMWKRKMHFFTWTETVWKKDPISIKQESEEEMTKL